MQAIACFCCFSNIMNTRSVRGSYTLISLLYCLFLLTMCFLGDKMERILGTIIGCPVNTDPSICYGISMVVRVSIGLLCLHFLLLLLMFARDNFSKTVNEGFFFFKFLIVALIAFAFLFVNNYYFRFYVTIASWISVVFLIYQSVSLIDFGYSWNEYWVERYETGTPFYGIVLVIFTLLFGAGSVALIVKNFVVFWIAGATYYKLALILNVVFAIVIVVLVLLKFNERSSVLTAAFVLLVTSYFNGTSLASYPSDYNPYKNPSTKVEFIHDSIVNIVVNTILAFIVIIRASLGSQRSEMFKKNHIKYAYVEHPEADKIKERLSGPQNNSESIIKLEMERKYPEKAEIYKTNTYVVFHMFMCFFAFYIVMIFFDFRELNIDFDEWKELKSQSFSGFSVKTFNTSVLSLLYVWTLIAPSCLQDRSFE